MDSPGFCAQYCTYSVMANESKQIICMVNIDKRETMRNSVIIEKEGFMQAFDTLRQDLSIAEICTDAHTQISALFSRWRHCIFVRGCKEKMITYDTVLKQRVLFNNKSFSGGSLSAAHARQTVKRRLIVYCKEHHILMSHLQHRG